MMKVDLRGVFVSAASRILDKEVQRILNEPYHIDIVTLNRLTRRKRSERRSVTKR